MPAGFEKLLAQVRENPTYKALSGISPASATETVPPLSYLTPRLGETVQGVVDPALRWIQKGLSGVDAQGRPTGPQNFASFAGLLGKPIVEPLLSTPFGLPLLAGAYGALRGGESFQAAKTLFGPALNKLGLA